MLDAYRVLDLTNNGAMFCGQILADLGADVIAVEPPGGSPARRVGPFAGDRHEPANSLYWWGLNRNKRSIVLDLGDEDDRDRVRQLAQTADFVIESFAPGYLDSLGLGYSALAEINPRIVMVSITPFGQQGPKAQWAATDLTVMAASGVLWLTGDEDRPPLTLPCDQAFLHAGAEAAVGALIAHTARRRDGAGQHVDVSAQTAAMMATQSVVLQWGWDKITKVRRFAGGVKTGQMRSRFVYPCKDGHVSVSFMFGPVQGPYTRRLFEWMLEEGFADEAMRDKDWVNYLGLIVAKKERLSELDRCTEAIHQFTLSHTKAELNDEAERRRVLLVPVSTTADVAASPQLNARRFWTSISHPGTGEPVSYPGPFATFSGAPIKYYRRPPLPGEHTAEILAELDRRSQESAAPSEPRPFLPDPRPALAGIKVLDFSWVFATPTGVRYLSDHGATVIHVESATRPDAMRAFAPFKDRHPGAERSGQYANVQAGKLGLSLNLKNPLARQVALRLVKWADVVVESFSPRAMRSWDMHYEALREVNPRIVMLSSCLNGQTGPQAMLAGFGTMGAQMAGFGGLVGWPDRAPSGPYSAYTDYTSPKLIAVSILAAIEHRRRTGEGQYIDFSQVEGAIHYLTPAMLDYFVNGRVQQASGNVSAEYAPHGVYPCSGRDRWVAIACGTDAQWQALCAATGHQEWRLDPRFDTFAARQEHREALDAALAAWTTPREVDAIEETLQAAGVPVHRASSSEDAFADPQLLFRQHFIEVKHRELGPVTVESSRMRLSRTPAQTLTAGPMFGEHNDRILREILDMNDEDIIQLVATGGLA